MNQVYQLIIVAIFLCFQINAEGQFYNANVEHLRSYVVDPHLPFVLLGASGGIYSVPSLTSTGLSEPNILFNITELNGDDVGVFTVQTILTIELDDKHFSGLVLYQPHSYFFDSSTFKRGTDAIGRNDVCYVSFNFYENGTITDKTLDCSLTFPDPVIDIEYQLGYLWVIDSAISTYEFTAPSTFVLKKTSPQPRLTCVHRVNETILWSSFTAIYKTYIHDINLNRIKEQLLPAIRIDRIATHSKRNVVYVLGKIGDSSNMIIEIDITTLSILRFNILLNSLGKPDFFGMITFVYIDEDNDILIFGSARDQSFASRVTRFDLSTFQSRPTFYDKIVQFELLPYPFYRNESNSFLYNGRNKDTETYSFTIFSYERCELYTSCESLDPVYCDYCISNSKSQLKGTCEGIAINSCPFISLFPNEITSSIPSFVNFTGYGVQNDLFELSSNDCPSLTFTKDAFYPSLKTIQFKILSDTSGITCTISSHYNGSTNVFAETTLSVVDCGSRNYERCFSDQTSVCGWCASSTESCTIKSQCLNDGFITSIIIPDLTSTIYHVDEPIQLKNPNIPLKTNCVVKTKDGQTASTPVTKDGQCLFQNQNILNQPLKLILMNKDHPVSYETSIEIYDCKSIHLCNQCSSKPKCKWCQDVGIGRCTIFDIEKDNLNCSFVETSRCPTVTNISPIVSKSSFPSSINVYGMRLNQYEDSVSDIRCSIQTLNSNSLLHHSNPIEIINSNTILCPFNSMTIDTGIYRISLSYQKNYSISNLYEFNLYTCDDYELCYDCLIQDKECQWDTIELTCKDSSEESSGESYTSFDNCPMVSSVYPSGGVNLNDLMITKGKFYCSSSQIDLLEDFENVVSTSNCNAKSISFADYNASIVGGPDGTIYQLSMNTSKGFTNAFEYSFSNCSSFSSCFECHSYNGCVWCPNSYGDEDDRMSCKGFGECGNNDVEAFVERSCSIQLVPDHGELSGGDEIQIIGGPFYKRDLFSPYFCYFGNEVVISQYCHDEEIGLTNCLKCKLPPSTISGSVKFELRRQNTLYVSTFNYITCVTTFNSKGCYDSFCPSIQSPCGYCASNRQCTVGSRCQGEEDLFLSQCVVVESANQLYYDVTGPGQQTLTFRTNPSIDQFVKSNSNSSMAGFESRFKKDDSFVINASPQATCHFETDSLGAITTYATIEDDFITCDIPENQSENSNITFSLLLPKSGTSGIPLTNPVPFPYVNCTKHETCSECKANPSCGWCLHSNRCSTGLSCNSTYFALEQCPEILGSSDDFITKKGTEIFLTGTFFIDNIFVNISGKSLPILYVNQTYLSFISPLFSGVQMINLVDSNGKTYSDGFFSLTYSKDNSLAIGLGVGLTLGLILVISLIIFIVYFLTRKKRKGISIQMVEPNYALVAFGSDIQLKYKYPTKGLDYLEEVLTRKGFEFEILLEKACDSSDQDDLAKSIMRITQHHHIASDCLSVLSNNEIMNCDVETTIFRGNSIASKMFTAYARMIGIRYLYGTIGRIIKELESLSDDDLGNGEDTNNEASLLSFNIELDADQLNEDEFIDEEVNVLSLKLMCQKIFSEITKRSIQNIPNEFKTLFYSVKDSCRRKFDNDETYYKAVGGLFFLRFVCPALTCPHIYGLTQKPPNTYFQRQMILISKVIQSVANMTIPGKKEPYLMPMTDFVEDNIPKVKQFYENIVLHKQERNRNDQEIEISQPVMQNSLAFTWNVLIQQNVKEKMFKQIERMENQNELKEIYEELLTTHDGKIMKKKK